MVIDETMDIAIDNDPIIYCKYLCDRTPSTSFFVGLVQLQMARHQQSTTRLSNVVLKKACIFRRDNFR